MIPELIMFISLAALGLSFALIFSLMDKSQYLTSLKEELNAAG